MKKNIFAIISGQLEKYLNRVQSKLYKAEAEIGKLENELSDSTGIKKLGLQARLDTLMDQVKKNVRKYNAVYSTQQAMTFIDDLFGSFKCRWIPIVALLLLLVGPIGSSISSFLIGTLVNTVIVVALMAVVMYAMKVRGSLPEMDTKDPEKMMFAKGIFLAVTVAKVLYSVLGPAFMFATVIVGAIAIAVYIERYDLKTLIQRMKDNNKKDGGDDDSDSK